jgi:hypothetical protein
MSANCVTTPDELIAKGICPVKPEFIRTIVKKAVQDAVTGSGMGAETKSKSKQKKVGADLFSL